MVTKIADGIDNAEKFFIFLTTTTVTKPWVDRELQTAIMQEIKGVDSNFIVPVKAGAISKLPPFIEAKKYIDLDSLTKEGWIAEFRSAIDDNYENDLKPSSPNVTHSLTYDAEGQNVVNIVFTASGRAEEFSYGGDTNEPILEAGIAGGGVFTMTETIREDFRYAYKFDSPLLRPNKPIAIRITFAANIDGVKTIKNVFIWEQI